jgi:hypothetical protein
MGKKHPNNGPSLSKSNVKRQRTFTEEELANFYSRKKLEQEQIERDAAKMKAFNQKLHKEGIFAVFPHLLPNKKD